MKQNIEYETIAITSICKFRKVKMENNNGIIFFYNNIFIKKKNIVYYVCYFTNKKKLTRHVKLRNLN